MPMLTAPADLDLAELRDLVSRKWAIEVAELERLAVGGDSWSFRAGDWFINVRDASGQRNAWRPRRDVEPAFDAAVRLRDLEGLDFLLAPTPTPTGRSLARLGRFAVTVMPYLDGAVHYRPYSRDELAQTTTWIARLHAVAVSDWAETLPTERFSIDCGSVLRTALERAEDGDAGPYSQPLRTLVRRYRLSVLSDLAEHEALAEHLRTADHDLVTTHGEPFPGNIFHAADGRRWLIDLSELTLAPKERDLGALAMLAAPGDRATVEQVYGAMIEPNTARFFQQRWGLEEIAIGVDRLSRSHTGTAEDNDVWTELTTHYLPLD